MKSKAFLNKVMAIMTAVMMFIQSTTVFASENTQNPTEASTTVEYEGLDPYYSVVVPTKIQLNESGMGSFGITATGDFGEYTPMFFGDDFNINCRSELWVNVDRCFLLELLKMG